MKVNEGRLHAMRGATTAQRNDPQQIREATVELMQALIERNSLQAEDVVSCIFTVTEDLDAEFPAVAVRSLGFEGVPLLCAREIPVPGALPRVIRVLIHYYPADGARPTHVYLREASSLRSDLQAPQ
jgi:chorismate mutase